MSPARKKLLRGALTLAVLGVVAYFFGRTLVRNADALSAVDFTFSIGGAVAILLFTLAVVISGLLWGRMTSELGKVTIRSAEAIRVHCLSWILKYVPGQMGSAANKIAWAAGRGISKTLTLLTFVYENVFMLIASIIPPAIILLSMGRLDVTGSSPLLLTLLSLIPLVAVTNRHLFRWASNLLARRTLKRDIPQEYFLRSAQALRYQFLYLIPRALNGAGLVAIAASMLAPEPSTLLPLAAAYIIAGAAGMLAIFVPSGLGVRESVFVLLATPFIPAEQAIVLSLAARFYASLADGVVLAVYGIMNARPTKGSLVT